MSRRNLCSDRTKRIYFIAFLCIGINLIIFNFIIYKSQINLLNKNWAQYFSKKENFKREDLGGLEPPKPLVPPHTTEMSFMEAFFGIEVPLSVEDSLEASATKQPTEGFLKATEASLGVKQATEASLGVTKPTEASMGVKQAAKTSSRVNQTMMASLEMKEATEASLGVKKTTEASMGAKQATESLLEATKASLGVKQTTEASLGVKQTTEASLEAKQTTEAFLGVKNSSEVPGSAEISTEKINGSFNRTKLSKKVENTAVEVWHEHKSRPVLVEPDIFVDAAVEMVDQGQNLSDCPKYPLGSVGEVDVKIVNASEVYAIIGSYIEELMFWSEPGGHYVPPCRSKQSLALIIPIQNSTKSLPTFLLNVHTFLRAQLLNYTFFVVQQEGPGFNKGQLMNAAYLEALKVHNFTCFIFHTPEKVPKNAKNMYQCSKSVRILSEGVFAVHRDVFRRINGFSNKIWGENGGDYDLKFRLDRYEIRATKPRKVVRKYELLTDKESDPGVGRRDAGYDYGDGLSNLDVKVKKVEKLPLFTKILVEISNVTSAA